MNDELRSAETMVELDWLASHPLVLVFPQALAAELADARAALGIPGLPPWQRDDLDDDGWAELMTDLLSGLGPLPDGAAGFGAWSDEATEAWRRAVAIALDRVLRTCEQVLRTDEPGAGATGLLLPASYRHRMEALLARGEMPLAWVRRLDLRR